MQLIGFLRLIKLCTENTWYLCDLNIILVTFIDCTSPYLSETNTTYWRYNNQTTSFLEVKKEKPKKEEEEEKRRDVIPDPKRK